MSRWRCFILIFLVAAAFRFYHLGHACYWYDEFGSLEASTGRGLAQLTLPLNVIISHPPDLTSLHGAPSAWKIWTSLDLDNHPPLYFLLLRLTRDCLGDAEWAVRLPSAIFSLLALLFFYLIVRRQLEPYPALAATLLLAMAGSQITLAQEARPYAMLLALSLICGWLVVRLTPAFHTPGEESKKVQPAWPVFFLCLFAVASLLTHYFAAPILLSLFIYAAIRLRRRARVTALLSIAIAAIIFALIWGPFFLRQLRSVSANNAWQYDDVPHHSLRILWHLMQLPARWLCEPAADFRSLVLIIFAWTVFAIFRCRVRGILFWILWAIPLVACIAISDMLRRGQSLYFMRYTFAAAPALCFLAGAFMQKYRHGWLAPAGLIAICLIWLPSAYPSRDDWRNAALDLQAHVQPEDTIIYTPGPNPVSWSQSTFLGISHYAPNLPAPILILANPQAPALSQALRRGHKTWIICFDPTLSPYALDPSATLIQSRTAPSFGRISEISP